MTDSLIVEVVDDPDIVVEATSSGGVSSSIADDMLASTPRYALRGH